MVYVNVSAWMRVSLCLCVRVYAGWWWWWYDIFHPVESMRSWFSMYSSFYCIPSHHPLFHAVVCRGERAPISIFTFPIFDNKLIQSMTTVLFVWRSSGNNSRRTDTKIRQKKIKVQSNIDWHHFHMHTLTHTLTIWWSGGGHIMDTKNFAMNLPSSISYMLFNWQAPLCNGRIEQPSNEKFVSLPFNFIIQVLMYIYQHQHTHHQPASQPASYLATLQQICTQYISLA